MKYRTKEDIEAAKAMISPPGDTLLETMEHYGIKQPELADRMGRPVKTINEIIKGKTAITPETALQLERVIGVPADMWMNLERNYRLELAAIADSEKLLEAEDWAKNFPVKQMIRYGWLEDTKDEVAMINNLLTYFSVADTDAFHNFYIKKLEDYIHSSFRIRTENRNSFTTWMRSADLAAHKTTLGEFNKSDFSDALQQILRLTLEKNMSDVIERITGLAQEAGVLVVFSPDLPGNNLSGSARWVYNKPVIQLKTHYKGAGEFWTTFYHEAGHILLHGKKDIFIDDSGFLHTRKEKEIQANHFAWKYLCTAEAEEELEKATELTHDVISAVGKRTNTNPAVLAQCLYANKKISERMVGRFEEEVVVG